MRVPELLLGDIENSVDVSFGADYEEGIVGAFGDENIAYISDESRLLNGDGLYEIGAGENCDGSHSLYGDASEFILAFLVSFCGEVNLGAFQVGEYGTSRGFA